MKPERYYIVAATPRTGSSLLCEGLKATGIAGRPDEVFAPGFRDKWYGHWALSHDTSFEEYLRVAFRHGTTDNGVYGLKIQWMHVATLARDVSFAGASEDVLAALFPGAAFVNIIRRDRRAQALSWFRAVATNEWWRFKDADNGRRPAPAPALDADAVRALEGEIERQQSAWVQYFRDRGIKPLTVEYEVLDADYRGQIGRALAFLGLDASVARSLPPPRLVRQSDDINLRWRRLMDTDPSRQVLKR